MSTFLVISELSSLGKGFDPSIEKLSPLHSRMLFLKFGWNLPGCSDEEGYLKFVNVFSLFPYFSFLKRDVFLISTNVSLLYSRMLCSEIG